MERIIQRFSQQIHDSAKQLQEFTGEIEGKEEQIKELLSNLDQFTSSQCEFVSSNAYGQAIRESTELLAKRVHQWVSVIENHVNGKDFINQFEKSVVVSVFGNVNAGKSSLGNWIAGNDNKVSGIYGNLPSFYVYDFNNGKTGAVQLENPEFKEGATETTASIQYFTLLDGLTWVDTPGIHSINIANEQLAKKYVDFADLILFVVPSSSPGKADEIEELNRLIEKQKSLLVAITKSDISYKDEIDGKLVDIEMPKSEVDRQKQQKYLAEVLKEKQVYNKIKHANFVSLSVNTAKRAFAENDTELFIKSGIPSFYEQIGEVLSSNAIQLKKRRPMAQINSTIEELVSGFGDMEGLKQVTRQLEEMRTHFEYQQQNLYQERQRVIDVLTSKAKLELDYELITLQQRFNDGDPVSVKDIHLVIENAINKHFQETVQKRLSNLIADVHINQCSAIQIAMEMEFESKYDTIKHQHYEVEVVSRNPKGFFEQIGAFFGKTYTESKVATYEKSKQISVGDNFPEILMQSHKELEVQVETVVDSALKEIENEYFNQNNIVMQEAINKLNFTIEELEKLKMKEVV